MGRVLDLGVSSGGVIADDGATITVGALAVLVVESRGAGAVHAAVGALGAARGAVRGRSVGWPAANVGAVVGGRGAHGAQNLALLGRVGFLGVVAGTAGRGGVGKGTRV